MIDATETAAVLDLQPVPVANADLINTLTVILENVRTNKGRVQEQVNLARQQDEINTETLRQFSVMEKALEVALSDPFNVQNIATALATSLAGTAVVPTSSSPQSGAGNTGADTEGNSGSAAPAAPEAGPYGTDANGSPVADHASDAS